jgi:hypothetical protein
MTVKRINTGIYQIEHNGVTYEVEKWHDGSWLLFEMEFNGFGYERAYANDFATLRDAKNAVAA